MVNHQDAFSKLIGRRREQASSEPLWLTQSRELGYQDFLGSGFPSRKLEEWKYTPSKSWTGVNFDFTPDEIDKKNIPFIDLLSGHEIFVISGDTFLRIGADPLQKGLSFKFLSQIQKEDPNKAELLFAQATSQKSDVFSSLNRTFFEDCAVLEVEKRTVIAKPITLIYLNSSSSSASHVHHPKTVIRIGSESELEINEINFGSGSYFVNSRTDIFLGDNSNLQFLRCQFDDFKSSFVGRTRFALGKHSKANLVFLSTGSTVNRNNIDVELAGEGAEAHLHGNYSCKKLSHTDFHTNIEHLVPHTISRQIFKGVVHDESKAVFNGRIFIKKDAQHSDAQLVNKNILLGAKAEVDTKPELEIYANDVKANHGATVGRLSDEELFYLQSRCIEPEQARLMLLKGFTEEVLHKIKSVSTVNWVSRFLESRGLHG